MRAERKTKVQPSQMDRSKKTSKQKPGLNYDTRGYAHAIRCA